MNEIVKRFIQESEYLNDDDVKAMLKEWEKFVKELEENSVVFSFGKYRGMTPAAVAKEGSRGMSYLKWFVNNRDANNPDVFWGENMFPEVYAAAKSIVEQDEVDEEVDATVAKHNKKTHNKKNKKRKVPEVYSE